MFNSLPNHIKSKKSQAFKNVLLGVFFTISLLWQRPGVPCLVVGTLVIIYNNLLMRPLFILELSIQKKVKLM